jgi:hypothetical protein
MMISMLVTQLGFKLKAGAVVVLEEVNHRMVSTSVRHKLNNQY